MKLFLYILFIILFIIKCNAYCDVYSCNHWCYHTQQDSVQRPRGANSWKVYGVCEPINLPPEDRMCRCGAMKMN
jgi:hypothetical protein